MEYFKGSKGGWETTPGGAGYMITRCSGLPILRGDIPFSKGVPPEEVEYNAKLIDAAPIMLQALINMRSQLIDGGAHEESVMIISIDTVISKATE